MPLGPQRFLQTSCSDLPKPWPHWCRPHWVPSSVVTWSKEYVRQISSGYVQIVQVGFWKIFLFFVGYIDWGITWINGCRIEKSHWCIWNDGPLTPSARDSARFVKTALWSFSPGKLPLWLRIIRVGVCWGDSDLMSYIKIACFWIGTVCAMNESSTILSPHFRAITQPRPQFPQRLDTIGTEWLAVANGSCCAQCTGKNLDCFSGRHPPKAKKQLTLYVNEIVVH